MARTTGIVLAMGGATVVNQSVFHDEPMDWRVPIATGILAMAFAAGERVWEEGAVILAWTGFIAVMLTRTNPRVPSPTESVLKWWNEAEK